MPGFVVHVGATVLCTHGGTATPTSPNPRVLVGGQPATTIAAPYTVAGCPFAPGGVASPCVAMMVFRIVSFQTQTTSVAVSGPVPTRETTRWPMCRSPCRRGG